MNDIVTNITCPKCSHKQKISIPNDKCLPFYKCDNCKETIGVPSESKNCCVVCEYSEDTCPLNEMSQETSKSPKNLIKMVIATVLIAICCFTPILVVTLGAIGLAFFVPYLDFILLPSLVIMVILTLISFGRYQKLKKSDKDCC